MRVHAMEPETYQALERIAARLCGGSDKMRDEGNLMTVLLRDRTFDCDAPDYLQPGWCKGSPTERHQLAEDAAPDDPFCRWCACSMSSPA